MITKEECLKIGGHCWNYFSANDIVDELGNPDKSVLGTRMRHLVYYPNGEPQYRRCKHCGITQKLSSAWE